MAMHIVATRFFLRGTFLKSARSSPFSPNSPGKNSNSQGNGDFLFNLNKGDLIQNKASKAAAMLTFPI